MKRGSKVKAGRRASSPRGSRLRGLGERDVCILIPCLNERPTIAKVIGDFRRILPKARILVGDNGSEDGSAEAATAAGAEVIIEPRRGKGYVVQALFRDATSDVLVLVDGDDTYPADAVGSLVEPILRGEADMVIGSRIMEGGAGRFRPVNLIGNVFYREVINAVFGTRLTDVLSGYRAMSRGLAESIPLFIGGFDTEVEMTIKTLERDYRIHQVPVVLGERPPGSHSKIHVVRDGLRILGTILALARDYKPLTFFGGVGLALALAGLALFWARSIPGGGADPNSVQLWGVSILVFGGLLLTAIGLILHTIDRRFHEMEHLMRIGRASSRKEPGSRGSPR